VALRPNADHGLLILEVSRSHTQRPTKFGRIPLDEWSARRRDLYVTTLTTDRHPCPRLDSNPQSQQANGRRSTPWPRGHSDGYITYLLTYLLTPWCRVLLEKLTGFAASQEIPRISRNPKVHYRIHKRPPPVSILGQPYPVRIPTSYLLEIHTNIIHPSTPTSPQWSPSLRFPHLDPIHPPLLTHTRHTPSPSHSFRFYHPHNIGWGVQII